MVISDPDHELVCRVARRDVHAYRCLVGRHLDKCIKVAERVLGNRQDAEDVVQEVCLKVWNEAERWQPKAKFSTWLYRVLVNACIDHRRKVTPLMTEVTESLADLSPVADEQMLATERTAQVRRLLQQLPERQRIAIVLSYYEDLSNQDAAEAMDLMLGAFQQLLYRARQTLKETLRIEENVQKTKEG